MSTEEYDSVAVAQRQSTPIKGKVVRSRLTGHFIKKTIYVWVVTALIASIIGGCSIMMRITISLNEAMR
jgi:hypothetical protein